MVVTHQASLLGAIETDKPVGEPAAEMQAEELLVGTQAATVLEPKKMGNDVVG